jgi:hypothetical protein
VSDDIEEMIDEEEEAKEQGNLIDVNSFSSSSISKPSNPYQPKRQYSNRRVMDISKFKSSFNFD